MNEADFTKRLLATGQEILALKTAHKRALSATAVNIKDTSLNMTANQTYLMTIIISPDSPPNPLLQVLLPSFESRYGRFSYYEDPNYPDGARIFYRKVRWVRTQSLVFRVLSSSGIQSITFEETTQ